MPRSIPSPITTALSTGPSTPFPKPTGEPVRVRRLTDHRAYRRPPTRAARSAPPVAARPTRQPRPVAGRPPTEVELGKLLVAVLEVLDGRRPITQLEPLLPAADQRDLLLRSRIGQRPRRLCTLRVQQPNAQAIELCATVADGPRLRALVGRVEATPDRWRFTLLRFL